MVEVFHLVVAGAGGGSMCAGLVMTSWRTWSPNCAAAA